MSKLKTLKTQPAQRKAGEPPSQSFPIVGIGASAGGLEAFTQLLKHLPMDTGMGFVLVQHLDPAHESALTQLLARATSLRVQEVTHNLPVKPNHIYVIPPNALLAISDGRLKLSPRPPSGGAYRAINSFFTSLAKDQRERAVGVILSGNASDGTLGLEAIKAEGGITLAQNESAKYDSMPRSAIAAGCVDFVLSPENIAKELARIARHPRHTYAAGQDLPPAHSPALAASRKSGGTEEQNSFQKIFLMLRGRFGVDFSPYKPGTLQRRVERRTVLSRQKTLHQYATFLKHTPKELDALYSDLLIGVTSFFRNPEAFEMLKRKVFPDLLARGRRDEPIRAWVLGCSTGQEAYSIAMVYAEASAQSVRAPKLQIFATDLNESALNRGRQGLYPKSLLANISPGRLERFFIEEAGGYRVKDSLRESIVFARQNLLTDPPFSKMDLVSCRNLMIYLEPDLQKKFLPAFHFALKPEGVLFLGASESIGNFTALFKPLDKKQKIFARRPGSTPGYRLPLAASRAPARTPLPSPEPEAVPKGLRGELNAQHEADRIAVNAFAPPSVLINAEMEILQFRGSTREYLEPSIGKASLNVLKMAKEGLLLPLRAAINQAGREDKTICKANVRVGQNGDIRTVNLQVVPLKNLKARCFLIFFETVMEPEQKTSQPKNGARAESKAQTRTLAPGLAARRNANLTRELAESRDYAQSLQEHHEAANEELQTANEEVQSANEELQSLNEELETSKEELESTNEEMTTVNEEVLNRNTELSRLNNDLNNLHVSVNMAILLLDRDLTIRRFTPLAEKIFNLMAGDVGRPFSGIKHNLAFTGLENLLREVIDTVSVREREVQDNQGSWFLLRVRPYLTLDNQVEGAVLLLMDIDALKRSEQEIKAARDYAEATLRTARDPLLILHADLRVKTANEAFYKTFQATPAQTEGRLIYELGNGQWQIPRLRQLLEDILPRNSFFDDFEIVHDFPAIGRRTMLVNSRRLETEHASQLILLSIEDVTERLESRAIMKRSEIRYRGLFEAAKDGIIILDPVNRKITDTNPFMTQLLGYSRAELLGKELWQIGLLKDEQASQDAFRELQESGFIRYEDLPLETKAGKRREVEFISNLYDEDGLKIIQCNIRDITDRKATERTLAEQARLLDLSNDAVIVRDVQNRITYWNRGAEELYGWTREEALGMDLDVFLKTEFELPFEQLVARLRRENRLTCEVVQVTRDGRRISAQCRLALDLDNEGNPAGILTTTTDITARKRAEETLQKVQAELQEHAASLEKMVVERTTSLQETVGELETFSYSVAHDMRAPLRSMRAFAQMLLDEYAGALDAKAHDYLGRIARSSNRLDRLIQDVLDYTKILRGQVTNEPVDLDRLLRDILDTYPDWQPPKAEIQIEGTLPRILGNEAFLTQCISNLLSNAVKFVPRGTVAHINIWAEPNNNQIRLCIRDNGIGIAPDKHARVFRMFERIHPASEYEGTGIGLTIARKAMERMGGEIGFDSEPGKGSTFWIQFEKG
ncbi:MAG: Protein-glutamate methylesterase [Pedosphaera sp.]|nr:Protein-glutamate methylesterase [Pedosphaera sp.]